MEVKGLFPGTRSDCLEAYQKLLLIKPRENIIVAQKMQSLDKKGNRGIGRLGSDLILVAVYVLHYRQ